MIKNEKITIKYMRCELCGREVKEYYKIEVNIYKNELLYKAYRTYLCVNCFEHLSRREVRYGW